MSLNTGKAEVLVDPKQLGRADGQELPAAERARRERARESATGIVSYSLDRSGEKACFSLAGMLFIVDIATGSVAMPTVSGPVFDPRLSPDGTSVAYVSGNSLRLVDVANINPQTNPDDASNGSGQPPSVLSADRDLASSRIATTSFGRSDFVAAEEMQRSRGFWWSPNGDQLLVTRVDEAPVQQWWIADPAHPDQQPNEIRYPVAGSANAIVDLLLVDLDGRHQQIIWDDNERFEYLADVIWSPGADPMIVRQTRDQREVSIASVNLETLELRELHAITDDIWVELIPGSPTLCDDGLLTIEDLASPESTHGAFDPGHRALLLNGRVISGTELNVRSIVGMVGTFVLITAWTVPTEVHLFLIDTVAGGHHSQLTISPGVHSASLGPPVVQTDGSIEQSVAISTARATADGIEVAIRTLTMESERARPQLGSPVAFVDDLSLRPPIKASPSFRQLGSMRLETAVFVPSNYDGSDPLPVLLDPYGGPHAQRVLKNYSSHLVSQWFAEQGFVVVVTDGRGTPGRGPAWERQVFGDLATPVLEDQLEALDDAADRFGVLDLNRVAIRGWSFGGYLAALAVLRHPDRFHAAIAGAPVTTWRLYDTHYTERYLGHPDVYPQHYESTDLLAEAHKLSRPLLLVHGLADDNVVAAHTLRFSTALLGAAAPHQVLPLSGVTHMTPQEAVAENLLWLQLRFLREALGIAGQGSGPAPVEPAVARPPAVHPKTAPLGRRQS